MASLPLFNCSSCKDDHHLHTQFLVQSRKNLPPHLSRRLSHHSRRISLPVDDFRLSGISPATSSRRILCTSAGGLSSIEREADKMAPRKHAGGKEQLRIRLNHQVKFGEHVAILGSAKELGSWKKKVPMTWTEAGWVLDLDLKGANDVEYKFVIVTKEKKMQWEEGNNRVLKLPKGGSFEMICHWNKTQESANLLQLDSTEYGSENEADTRNGPAIVSPISEGEPSPFVQEWQGRAASFMRSNEHGNREADRRWNTEGLEGSSLKLVEGDRSARNWRRKVWLPLFSSS